MTESDYKALEAGDVVRRVSSLEDSSVNPEGLLDLQGPKQPALADGGLLS